MHLWGNIVLEVSNKNNHLLNSVIMLCTDIRLDQSELKAKLLKLLDITADFIQWVSLIKDLEIQASIKR